MEYMSKIKLADMEQLCIQRISGGLAAVTYILFTLHAHGWYNNCDISP